VLELGLKGRRAEGETKGREKEMALRTGRSEGEEKMKIN
jgi:hypothetical protein